MRIEIHGEDAISVERQILREIKRGRGLGRTALEIGAGDGLQLFAGAPSRQDDLRVARLHLCDMEAQRVDLGQGIETAPRGGRFGRGTDPVQRQLAEVAIRHVQKPRSLSGREEAQRLLRIWREQTRAERLQLLGQQPRMRGNARIGRFGVGTGLNCGHGLFSRYGLISVGAIFPYQEATIRRRPQANNGKRKLTPARVGRGQPGRMASRGDDRRPGAPRTMTLHKSCLWVRGSGRAIRHVHCEGSQPRRRRATPCCCASCS